MHLTDTQQGAEDDAHRETMYLRSHVCWFSRSSGAWKPRMPTDVIFIMASASRSDSMWMGIGSRLPHLQLVALHRLQQLLFPLSRDLGRRVLVHVLQRAASLCARNCSQFPHRGNTTVHDIRLVCVGRWRCSTYSITSTAPRQRKTASSAKWSALSRGGVASRHHVALDANQIRHARALMHLHQETLFATIVIRALQWRRRPRMSVGRLARAAVICNPENHNVEMPQVTQSRSFICQAM